MTPRLEEIDLSKRVDCHHPEVKEDRSYLAKIYGSWYAGKFSRQWYGFNFDAVYDAGIQLNSEGWQKLYLIVEHKQKNREKNVKRNRKT